MRPEGGAHPVDCPGEQFRGLSPGIDRHLGVRRLDRRHGQVGPPSVPAGPDMDVFERLKASVAGSSPGISGSRNLLYCGAQRLAHVLKLRVSSNSKGLWHGAKPAPRRRLRCRTGPRLSRTLPAPPPNGSSSVPPSRARKRSTTFPTTDIPSSTTAWRSRATAWTFSHCWGAAPGAAGRAPHPHVRRALQSRAHRVHLDAQAKERHGDSGALRRVSELTTPYSNYRRRGPLLPLGASASFRPVAQAQNPPAGGPNGSSALTGSR
jgi:hypothetical protein